MSEWGEMKKKNKKKNLEKNYAPQFEHSYKWHIEICAITPQQETKIKKVFKNFIPALLSTSFQKFIAAFYSTFFFNSVCVCVSAPLLPQETRV